MLVASADWAVDGHLTAGCHCIAAVALAQRVANGSTLRGAYGDEQCAEPFAEIYTHGLHTQETSWQN